MLVNNYLSHAVFVVRHGDDLPLAVLIYLIYLEIWLKFSEDKTMIDEDINKLRGVIKEELKPINEKLGNLEQKIDIRIKQLD